MAFISDFFGIIPFDLSFTFPMGQYESINNLNTADINYHSFAQRVENFLKLHGKHYYKCGVLLPYQYINQFNEETEYSKKNVIIRIFNKLKSKLILNFSIFKGLPGILQFFKDD